MTEKQLDCVLDWVNRQRVKMAYKPIKALKKGNPAEAYSCPLARSLRAGDAKVLVDGSCFIVWKVGRRRAKPNLAGQLPDYIKQFIRAFDADEVPELIKKG